MNRRSFLKSAGLAVGVVSGWSAASPAAGKKQDRPNILWIIAEDMNDWMSCYGDRLLKTPAFDAMAQKGVRFTRAYVTAPVCSACRSALITGAMQTSLGIHNHRSSRSRTKKPEHSQLGMINLPEGVKTVPQYFQDAGYATFNSGKTDYNFVYKDAELYSVRGWKDAKGKPWFGQIQLGGGKRGARALPPGRKNPVDVSKVTVPPYYPDHEAFRKAYAGHYANILGTDYSAAGILKKLESDRLLDNTIVFFFSDHGAPPLLRHKQFCYEGGVRVPLLVRWPENFRVTKPGLVIDDLVSSIDISVTSMALAGLDVPKHMEGRSIFAKDYKPRDYVISARDRCDYTIERIRAVVTKKYKYLRNFLTDRPYLQPQYRDNSELMKVWKKLHAEGALTAEAARFAGPDKPAEELYDLEKDPHEVRNLAGDPKYGAELARHRKILAGWMKETDDKGQYPESTEGLLQVMYKWGDKCVNPEYGKVRKKYGKLVGGGDSGGRKKRKKKAQPTTRRAKNRRARQ
ncbi:MAG: sulfatase [Phycisphaerae bacterium]|jgi:arylsulfatase A-like enzyme|nr:sulfatase [Phycisphaerae bacterium]